MRKRYLVISFLLVSLISSKLGAQTVFITTGTAGTPAYNAGPVYRSAAASAFDASRYTYLYTASELAAAGITSGSVINLVGWVKNNTATSLGAGGIFRIYMKNTSAASFSLGSETWANLNTGAVMVYENLTQTIPATANPTYIDFPLTTSFTYTGGSLEISTEWDINQVAGNASTGTFDWLWSTVVDRIYGTGNTTLAPITTLSSTTNSISTIDDRRPFIKITYTGGTTGIDVGAQSLVAPAVSANNCYTSAEPVTIRIRNLSTNPIDFSVNPMTVTTNVTGAVTQTLTGVVNTGTLAAAATLDVPMSATLNMSATGVYTFNAFTTVTGDVTPGNNAMTAVNITKAVLAAGTASVSPGSLCITGTPTLSTTGATGYGGLQWQESTTPVVGFTNIPGATTSPYTLASPITQTMYYRLVASCNGNNVTSNEVTVTVNSPQVTGTAPGASCGPGPVAVTLGATGSAGTTLNWYNGPSGGVPVGTGSSFITPPISVNTTYYVSASNGGGSANLGLPAQLAGTSGFGTTNFGLVFDALVPFTLNSVVVYPVAAAAGTAGTVTIDVINSAGTILNTATVNVIGNPTATANTVTLNFNIAAGTNLKLRPGSRSASITALLFEPSATAPPGGNYGYPFVVPGVVSINHSTLTAAPANTPRLDLYYYFYNWTIATGCESARTPVLATVTTPPSATISYAGSPYCTNGGTATVTRTGTAGGTYSSTAGLTINPTTGDITLGTSTPSTYTVTYTIPASGGCPVFTTTASITITAGPSATISYNGSPYCTTGGTATVTRIGTAGGTYSSTAGLTLNPANGDVTLGTSTPGTYTVTYTIAASGGCPLFTTTASITVNNCGISNNECAGATILTSANTCVPTSGTNVGATQSIAPLTCGIFTSSSALDVWYQFTAVATSHTVTVVGGAGFDAIIDVRSGACNGTNIGCADATVSGGTEVVTLGGLTIGNVYLVRVYGWAGGTGTFTICVTHTGAPPCNCAITGSNSVCSGTTGNSYSGPAGMATYAWSITGNGTITSATNIQTITVTAGASGSYTLSLTTTNAGCSSSTCTLVVTVNAGPSATITYAGSPYCQNGGTATVTRIGTAGGTYSSTAGLTINAANGDVTLGTSTAGTYTVTYTIAASGGCPVFTTTASITINPIPNAVATPASQTICTATPITTIVLSGAVSGTTYAWTRDNLVNLTGIAASGSGNISGTLTNTTNVAQTTTFTITPTANGCPGAAITATITVNPTPTVNVIANQTLCNGAATAAVNFTGAVAGTVYNWTNNQPSIGLAPSGSGNIASFTATNTGTAPVVATITVTPSYTNAGTTCTGTPRTFTLTVNPTPTAVATPPSQTICSNTAITTIVLTSPVAGTTYAWTRSNTANVTGIAASGTGNISGTLVNTTTSQQTVTFTITPTANGCPGPTTTATVIVQAPLTIVCPGPITVNAAAGTCAATVTFAATVTGTPAPTVTYSPASGSSFPVGTTTVTATATNACGTVSCQFTVTVNDVQVPVITTQTVNRTVCVGTTAIFSVVSTFAASYQWQIWNGTAWVNIPSTNAATLTLTNVTHAMNANSYRVIVTGPCGATATSTHATLYVNPLPTVSIASSGPTQLLPAQTVTLTAVVAPPGGSYVWFKNGSVIPGATTNTIAGLNVLDAGTYRVTYTDPNGCVNTSADVIVSAILTANLYIYPNPNTGQFNVRFYNAANEEATITVFNSLGAIMFQKKFMTGPLPYSIVNVDLGQQLAIGTYFVDVRNSKGEKVGTEKISVGRQ